MARPQPRPQPRKRRKCVHKRLVGSTLTKRNRLLPNRSALVPRNLHRGSALSPLRAPSRKLARMFGAAATMDPAGFWNAFAPWVPENLLGGQILASSRVPDAAETATHRVGAGYGKVVEKLLADARLRREADRRASSGPSAYSIDVREEGYAAAGTMRAVRNRANDSGDDEGAHAFRNLVAQLRGMGIGDCSGAEVPGELGTGARRGVVGRIMDVEAKGWVEDSGDKGDWEEVDEDMTVDV